MLKANNAGLLEIAIHTLVLNIERFHIAQGNWAQIWKGHIPDPTGCTAILRQNSLHTMVTTEKSGHGSPSPPTTCPAA